MLSLWKNICLTPRSFIAFFSVFTIRHNFRFTTSLQLEPKKILISRTNQFDNKTKQFHSNPSLLLMKIFHSSGPANGCYPFALFSFIKSSIISTLIQPSSTRITIFSHQIKLYNHIFLLTTYLTFLCDIIL